MVLADGKVVTIEITLVLVSKYWLPFGRNLHKEEECSTERNTKPSTCCDRALLDDARRNRGLLSNVKLNADEDSKEHTKDDKERNDTTAAPRICATAPLERKQEADDHGQEDDSACRIEIHNTILPANGKLLCAFGGVEEEENKDHSDSSEGKVASQIVSTLLLIDWTYVTHM